MKKLFILMFLALGMSGSAQSKSESPFNKLFEINGWEISQEKSEGHVYFSFRNIEYTTIMDYKTIVWASDVETAKVAFNEMLNLCSDKSFGDGEYDLSNGLSVNKRGNAVFLFAKGGFTKLNKFYLKKIVASL
jgi:hypothetical protein